MAPFRPSGRSNRSGRSQADHDVFEGLPIKQWRQSETTIGLPQVVGEAKPGDTAMPELAMPRDSHLLSQWTQALLREARRPRLAKRKEPTEDEKGDEEEEGNEKEQQTGFLAKKWSHVPAHLEEPEREYIAKRRKGLPSLHTTLALQAAISLPATTATRKAKIAKADAEGKTTIYEVLVPEGQVVEGEVHQDTEMPDAAAPERAVPGTVIEGVGIANAEGVIVANDLLQPQPPPRRRNMPPKRVKKGGPGRGKKKVMFTAEGQAGTSTPGGTGAPSTPATGDGGATEPMDVDSARKEEDDGEDDDDDDDDREDGEISDAEGGQQETPSHPNDLGVAPATKEPVTVEEVREEVQNVTEGAPPPTLEVSAEAPITEDATMQDAASPAPDTSPSQDAPAPSSEETPKPETIDEIHAEPETANTQAQSVTEVQNEPSASPEKPLAEPSDVPSSKAEEQEGNAAAEDKEGEEDKTVPVVEETTVTETYQAEEASAAPEVNQADDDKVVPEISQSEEYMAAPEAEAAQVVEAEAAQEEPAATVHDDPIEAVHENQAATTETYEIPISEVEAAPAEDTAVTESTEQPSAEMAVLEVTEEAEITEAPEATEESVEVPKKRSDALSAFEAALDNQDEDES